MAQNVLGELQGGGETMDVHLPIGRDVIFQDLKCVFFSCNKGKSMKLIK